MFNTILEKLQESISSVQSTKEMLIRLIIGLAIFIVALLFKGKIAQFIVFIFNKTVLKKHPNGQKAISESLTKPLSYFLLIDAVYASTEIIAPSGEIRNPILFAVKLAFIITSAWFGIRLIGSDNFMLHDESSQTKKTAVKFISNIMRGAIATFAILLVLEQFGFSASKLFAALGLGGVAVAFACKDAVENMLSGFIIIFDKPFEVEDFIEVEGVSGTVEDIKIRTTRIRALDGSERVFPNTKMANAVVTNWTKISSRSVSATYGLTYSMTSNQVTQFTDALRKILTQTPEVDAGGIRISFDSYGDSALEINAFFVIEEADINKFKSVLNNINLRIKDYVDSSDIEMAFNTHTVHIAKD